MRISLFAKEVLELVSMFKSTQCRRDEEKKERLARARAYEEELWAAEEAEAAMGRGSCDGHNEQEEDIVDELYCMACDKRFKSQNAFANHER